MDIVTGCRDANTRRQRRSRECPTSRSSDGQNLHLGITGLGWKLDWRRFRVYLGEHYDVARAYYFVGYIPDRQAIYTRLQDVGYVDAELVLQTMIELPHYDRAVIVTSDGDFACLVRYLYEQRKLERVLSPNRTGCSALLKRAARERLDFLENAKRKIEYKS